MKILFIIPCSDIMFPNRGLGTRIYSKLQNISQQCEQHPCIKFNTYLFSYLSNFTGSVITTMDSSLKDRSSTVFISDLDCINSHKSLVSSSERLPPAQQRHQQGLSGAAQTVFLSKQVRTIVAGRKRCSDDRSSPSLYTSKVIQYTPEAKRPRAWLVLFLETMLPLQWQI